MSDKFITERRNDSKIQEFKTLQLKRKHRNGHFEVELSNGTILKVRVEFRTYQPSDLARGSNEYITELAEERNEYAPDLEGGLIEYAPGFFIEIESINSELVPIQDYVKIGSFDRATKSGQQQYHYKTSEDEVQFLIRWEGNIAKGTFLDGILDLYKINAENDEFIIRTPKEHQAYVRTGIKQGWLEPVKKNTQNDDELERKNKSSEWKNGLKHEVDISDIQYDNVIDMVAWRKRHSDGSR